MAIPPISSSNPIPIIPEINSTQKSSASSNTKQITQSFEDMLTSLNQSQQNSDNLVEQLARGEDVDLHTVMIAMEENNVNFNVALGVRDKLIEAYREIMRMQVLLSRNLYYAYNRPTTIPFPLEETKHWKTNHHGGIDSQC